MKAILEQKIREAIGALQKEGVFPVFDIPKIRIERPKDDQFGEYTTNAALSMAKQAGKSPREIAELIKERLIENKGQENFFEKIEVAGLGHLNFYLSQPALADVVKTVIEQGAKYGASNLGQGKRIDNEFVSANPTGPLHLGNARGGFFGDTLSRVLRKAGFEVVNEYYVNDAGEQVVKLGHSVLQDSEAVYGGEYIDELHARLAKDEKSDVSVVGREAAKIVLDEHIKPTLSEKMHIAYDLFVSEKTDIVEAGYVDKALGILREKGLAYENEGALWLRTTDFGDDKDRVLVKGDGSRTYFASDCGYLLHKMERGFDAFVLTLGADHHGYTMRLRAAAQALGFAGDFRFVLVQLVKLVKDGQEVRMSKRAGNVVTVDELIEVVGYDVARFFFLMYSSDTHMNFDLGLAEERSQKNPVFYVEYAHARLASILRKAEEAGLGAGEADLSLLTHEKERLLIRELMAFQELIESVAEEYAVHKLPQYAIRLADRLHSFYDQCTVIDPEHEEVSLARLSLVRATKAVLGETLALMGIEAPEKM